ncbi:FtsJ like methyltransferase Methyltransferase domain [Trypanosoma vivax]|uniref:rRNA methyltransferase 2, mitochondrial n=1 Tax=Trypanosoma vivax (strain Y486) TaxID=1055687 RepID=G0U0I8_TRYVY|nr:putative ribosomal rRNA methyltransferase [Trypanosoma vivax]KAH8610906.1 FtsJ like methyltransferase Methyltransferase domain [Trypanosoma vivax]CCC49587.1 putative ribosomal RNA methyltransferase [Trypanosoma vivax Y486]
MYRPTGLCWLHGGRQWVQRQAQDQFVVEARRCGYVARSAFKLQEIDDKFGLFSRAQTHAVVDIGCSPGSWLQVIRERCSENCALFGVDILRVAPSVTDAVCIQGDFTSVAVQQELLKRMTSVRAAGNISVVTSDMCLNRGSGDTSDRQKQEALNRAALAFALAQLLPGGHFVCKVLGAPTAYKELRYEAQQWFGQVAICKPKSSRRESDEAFMVCKFKRDGPRSEHMLGTTSGQFGLDDWPGFQRGKGRR